LVRRQAILTGVYRGLPQSLQANSGDSKVQLHHDLFEKLSVSLFINKLKYPALLGIEDKVNCYLPTASTM
jgi:hypothetical protein